MRSRKSSHASVEGEEAKKYIEFRQNNVEGEAGNKQRQKEVVNRGGQG